ncbi:AsmA-like C-terminal region-containing protein [Aureimonas sp. AU4]|uniref:AsmA family protein n=1 Tax=Aureimonas sp. AU4 TaxID=1638163 RepID=UPI0007807518|nr:AsmA-like C-terminal region-containing protein [Aureimonas sp. AU4]
MPNPLRPVAAWASRRLPPRGSARRRRRVLGALAVLGLLCAGLALLVSQVSLALPDARREVEARLSRLLDGPVHVDGQASFSLLPLPRASLRDVRILAARPDEDPVAVDIDQVDADFDVVAALFGRVAIKRVTLLRPEIMTEAPEPVASPPPAAEAPPLPPAIPFAAQTPEASRRLDDFLQRFSGINEIRVRDGLLRVPGQAGGFSNANLVFRWPGEDEAATLSGSYVWNGEPTQISLVVERPRPFLAGTASPLSLTLNAPPLAVLFSGEGSAGDRLQLAGRLQLSTPSLSRTVRWLGERSLTLPDFGALAFDTQLKVFGTRASLGALELNLGGNQARGALEATRDEGGRPAVSGTLAFDTIDLAAFGGAMAPPPRALIDFQRPLRTAFLRDIDIDLRLSAARASLDRLRLGELAAAVKVTAGRAVFDVGDMAILGGRGQMRLSLDTRPPNRLSGSARLRGIGLASLRETTGTLLPLSSGTADIEVDVDTPADNWGDVALANRTRIEVSARDGALAGLDLRLLREAGSHKLSAAEAGAGFRTLTAHLEGTGGTLRLDTARIETQEGATTLSGRYDLRTAGLEATGSFDPAKVEASGRGDTFIPSQPIPFRIGGEWPSPEMTVGPPRRPI